MKVSDLLASACAELAEAGIDTPGIDAELLLGHCLGKSRTELYLSQSTVVPERIISEFSRLLQRRLKREPLAHIVGFQEFWSLDFIVTPDVLIPRPETEFLLEQVLAWCEKSLPDSGLILDLCCGSGAIAVVLAKELERQVIAVDISLEALKIAEKNSVKHGVSHLISFHQADLLSALIPLPVFSLIVSNPPYVGKEEIVQGMQQEVFQYEPHLALDGGPGGLEIIERIRDQALVRMEKGAHLFMEVGTGQKKKLLELFSMEIREGEQFFENIWVKQDYSGHDRVFHASMKT